MVLLVSVIVGGHYQKKNICNICFWIDVTYASRVATAELTEWIVVRVWCAPGLRACLFSYLEMLILIIINFVEIVKGCQ